jgi:hypothetical protein
MTTLEILRAARALLTDPQKWGKREYVKGGRYCLIGACAIQIQGNLHSISFPGGPAYKIEAGPVGAALARVVRENGGCGVTNWNDMPRREHGEVLAALDQAIANEMAREQEFVVTPAEDREHVAA